MSSFSQKYTLWLEKYKYLVLLFWSISFIACVFFAPRLINKTTYTFDPPAGSIAYTGNKAMQEAFPNGGSGASNLAVFIYTTDGSTVLRDDVEEFSMRLNNSIYEYDPSNPNFIEQVMGYYIAMEKELLFVATRFLSTNQTSTIIAITVAVPYASPEAVTFSNYVQTTIDQLWNTTDKSLKYELLGISAFLPILQNSAEHDFLIVDGISLPLALLVLAYILRSLRLMLLPIVCIGTSIVITFGLMYFVATLVPVVAFTPSLMMSILVAMSFDYSLFLLSRYREDLFSGESHQRAIEVMLASAGHTVVVSGITLAGTFMGLAILPLVMLRTLGLGSAISIIVTLLVNISLTPALLFTFNKFFPRCVEPFVICGRQINFGARLGETKLLINDKVHGVKSRSFWYKLGRITTSFPWNIALVVVIIGLTIPFALHATNYEKTDSFDVALPRHYPLTDAYNVMVSQFGYGAMYPYVLLMQAPENQTVMSTEFFSVVQTLLSELAHVPNTAASNIISLPYAMGSIVTYDEVVQCTDNTVECISFQYAEQTLVNSNRTAMLAYVALSWDPMSQNGFAWLDAAREVLDKNSDKSGATFYFTGVCSDSLDAVRYVYSAFTIMGAVTCAVVLVFVGFAFRSLFVPLRSILTIMITLAFVYGFATLTYQYEIFKWTHFEGLYSFGALSWIPPLVSFSIIVGIGLDYDIFLITRIQEFRAEEKYSTRDAIMKGVHKTGGIITAAGVIMAIAFSGLLMSSISAMNQLSFYLVFAVLFDTFVVRSLLVPSLMGLLLDMNWWPKRMPEPTKSLWF